jgi:hypothetical protein
MRSFYSCLGAQTYRVSINHNLAMENLPIELQRLIFDNLYSLDDLRSVRAVSKIRSELISPRLFEKITITTRSDSFERLASICESQVARHVRCLHYDLLALPLVSKSEWGESLARLRRIQNEDNSEADFATYDEYKEFYDGQLSGNEVDRWTSAFNKLSSLTSLEVSEHGSRMNKKIRKPIIDKLSKILQWCPAPGTFPSGSLSQVTRPVRLESILTAVQATSRRLTSLSLNSVRASWLDLSTSKQWNKDVAAESVFGDLKILKMSVRPLYHVTDTQTATFLQKAVMKHARNLTELQIRAAEFSPSDFWNMSSGQNYNVYVVGIHLGHLWSVPSRTYSIRSLHLRRMSASSPELHNLFQALAPTLIDLSLKSFQLSSGSWVLMWRSMAETLQLREIKLRGQFGAAAEAWNQLWRGRIKYQNCSPLSEDPPTTPWSQMMFDLGCFFWEKKPTSHILGGLGEWILSGGQGEFPLVPFYTLRCSYHHYPSTRIYNACSRESAVRELLGDSSFVFERDKLLHTREEQAVCCPKTCRNYVHDRDCIAMPLFQEHYIKQLLSCLMVLQRLKIVVGSRYFRATCFAGQEGSISCCNRQRHAIMQSYSDDMSTLAITLADPELSGQSGGTLPHHQRCLRSFGRQAITLNDARREIERKSPRVPELTFYSANIIYLVKNFIKVVDTLNGNGLFENLCDGAQHMTASGQARSFYELLLKAAGEGLLMQDALHE